MAIEIRGLCPLLQVYDMPASIRFYRDLLGFEVANHSPVLATGSFHWALLRWNETQLMLNTTYESNDERPPAPNPARFAAHSDTVLYLACPDVEEACRQLRALGLEVKEPHVAPYGMKQLDLIDPDGYHLCFQWPA